MGEFGGCPRVTGWEPALHHLGRATQMGTDSCGAMRGEKGRGLGRTHPAKPPAVGPLMLSSPLSVAAGLQTRRGVRAA